MKDLYSRAITEGRKMSPRRRHNAAANKPARVCSESDKITLIVAICSGYLRGEIKPVIRMAL